MQNLSANKKTRLIAPSTALFVLIAVVALLFFLRSSDQIFTPEAGRPDQISASYTELLLQRAPENDKLRLSLIDLYLELAQFDRAQKHWHLLHNIDTHLKDYYQFKINSKKALGLSLEAQYPELVERVAELHYADLNVEQQVQLADLALQLGATPVAAQIYENLANNHHDQQQFEYFDLAAQWYSAGNQHYQSARIHAFLAQQHTAQQRIDYQRKVVADYLAASDPAAAVKYLHMLTEQPEQHLSSEQLMEAVTVAMLTGDLKKALYFNSLLIEQEPENVEAHLAALRLNLAAGDVEQAWQLRHWLLEAHPDNVDTYVQLAELAEWNHAFADALELWIKALELEYDAKRYEHAWRLAIQLFDFERSLQLLSPIREQRQLTDIELQALFYSHGSRGTPEEAEQWLREYVGQYPSHRLGWTYLQQKFENLGQYTEEIAVWSSMAQRFTLQAKELMRWAEAHMLNYDVEGAWGVLNNSQDLQITDADYWHLKAAVAWELEDDEQFLLVYQRMEQENIKLYRAELDQLIGLFARTNPEKALELTLQRWERWHNEQDLMNVVYLGLELSKWELLQSLVDAANDDENLRQSAPIFLARASLAVQQLDYQLAENILQQAIERYPSNNLFREHLLWLYIATDQRETIKELLSKWQGLAEDDSRLWLPFAASNQLLNRSVHALAWYQRYIELNPADWLVKAAFADALEGAEYFDAALVQRHALLSSPIMDNATEARYRTWLNLLAANYGQKTANEQALAWQDGTQSMLQLWFEQQLTLLSQPQQEQQKTFWLTWAKQQKLLINDYEQIEQALRSFNLAEVQRLLVSQRIPKAQQVAALKALNSRHAAGALALSELGDEHPASTREQLRRQALEELKTYPQGMQVGWQQRDFGGAVYSGVKLTAAHAINDRWYARVDAEHGELKIENRGTFNFAKEKYLQLALNRQLHNGSLDLSINHSNSDIKSRTGASIARNWQITQKSSLSLGYDWQDRTDESGFMYVLGQKNSLWLRGNQQMTARDSLSWGVEKNDYATRYNEKLGSGKAFELQLAHTIFFEHPTWLVKAGFDYQKNNLNDKTLTRLPVNPADKTAFNTNSLLSEKYKYAYLGTTLQRGTPGFLNRTEPQYTWILDAVIGRQWPENKMTYSLSAGIGTQVFGDDELAFTFGYQSAPKSQLDSQSGGTIGVSYSARFGR